MAFAIMIVAVAVLIPRRGLKRHQEALPTTIIAPTLPPLAQTKLLTKKLVALAAEKADAYWNGTRCNEGIRFDYRPLVGRVIARARWYATSLRSSRYHDCLITFNTDPTKVKVSFYHYCAALIHEYGHLAGRTHSLDRTNLMFPVLLEDNIPDTCKVRVFVSGVRL